MRHSVQGRTPGGLSKSDSDHLDASKWPGHQAPVLRGEGKRGLHFYNAVDGKAEEWAPGPWVSLPRRQEKTSGAP